MIRNFVWVFVLLWSSVASADSCRQRISEVLIEIDFSKPGEIRPAPQFAPQFEAVYDLFPPVLQKVFCHLDHLALTKGMPEGTGFAAVVEDDSGKITGYGLGLRKEIVDPGINFSEWASWKDQLNFGQALNSPYPSPMLPLTYIHTRFPNIEALAFVLAHEFGHLLDDTNHFTAPKGAWAMLSTGDFFGRDQLCFYQCNGKSMWFSDINRVYDEWDQTSYISLYGSTRVSEDFPETLAYYVMAYFFEMTYWIDTRQGLKVDVIQKLESLRFEPKKRYIEWLLNEAEIRYPEQIDAPRPPDARPEDALRIAPTRREY